MIEISCVVSTLARKRLVLSKKSQQIWNQTTWFFKFPLLNQNWSLKSGLKKITENIFDQNRKRFVIWFSSIFVVVDSDESNTHCNKLLVHFWKVRTPWLITCTQWWMLFESLYDTLGHMIFWALFTEIFNYFWKLIKCWKRLIFTLERLQKKRIKKTITTWWRIGGKNLVSFSFIKMSVLNICSIYVQKGWFQTLFLQILKSLNFKISTQPSNSASKIN